MPHKMFLYFASAEALCAIPLAYFLPFSRAALVLTVALLAGLNLGIVAIVSSRVRFWVLQLLNLVGCGVGLSLALLPNNVSLRVSAGIILLACLFQLALGYRELPDRLLKQCLVAQLFALTSTVLIWMVFRKYGLAANVAAAQHLDMALRLFGAPLILVAISCFAQRIGTAFQTICVAICAGQFGIGFFDLGAALQMTQLFIIGFVFCAMFFVLLAMASIPALRSRLGA